MSKILTWLVFLAISFLVFGCRCSQIYLLDSGKDWRAKDLHTRYNNIKEQDYILSVNAKDSQMNIDILTKFQAPNYIKDRGVKIVFDEIIPVLQDKTILEMKERESIIGYSDSTLKHRVKDQYYTCENFDRKIKKSNLLYLTIRYHLDSSDIVTRFETNYILVRKKHCYLTVH